MRNYISRYIYRVLQLLLGFAIASWTAHVLGPSGRGDIAAAQVTIGLTISLTALGLPTTASYLASRHPERAATLIGNSVIQCLVSGGGAAIILALFWIPRQHLESMAWPICLGQVVQLLFLVTLHLALGLGEYKLFNSLEAVTRTMWMGLLLAFFYSGKVMSAVVVVATQQAAYGLGWLITAARCLQRSSWQVKVDARLARTMVPFSLKIYGSALAHDVLLAFDLLLVHGLRGSVEAGLYSSATLLGNMILQNCQIVSPLLMRELSPLNDIQARWSKAQPIILGGTMLSLVGAIFIGALGGTVLSTFLGEQFVAAWPALLWILPGLVMLVCGQLCEMVLVASGQPAVQPVMAVLLAILNVVLNLLVVPTRGYLGAAKVATLTYGLWMLGTMISLAYYLRHPSRLPQIQAMKEAECP